MSAGSVILFVGLLGLTICVMAGSGGISLGGIITGSDERNLLIAMSVGLIILGFKRLRREGGPADGWEPEEPGIRFQRVIVYSRDGCALCDEAMDLLERYSRYFNDLSVVSIADSEELTEKYGSVIPVVEFDGEVRFQGKVNERLLRRLIEGTPVMK